MDPLVYQMDFNGSVGGAESGIQNNFTYKKLDRMLSILHEFFSLNFNIYNQYILTFLGFYIKNHSFFYYIKKSHIYFF